MTIRIKKLNLDKLTPGAEKNISVLGMVLNPHKLCEEDYLGVLRKSVHEVKKHSGLSEAPDAEKLATEFLLLNYLGNQHPEFQQKGASTVSGMMRGFSKENPGRNDLHLYLPDICRPKL